MDWQEVIQAKRIELLDDQGEPSLILTGRYEENKAAVIVSSVEENAPLATLGIDLDSGRPFFLLGTRGEGGASASITLDGGRVYLNLRNVDGSGLTITPQ